jgi:uncharacterized HAD superfamily protein
MKKPVLAVDIDEVLFPFTAEFLRAHNTRFGTGFTPAEVSDLSLDILGFTPAQITEMIHEFSRQDQSQIPPLATAMDGLSRLKQDYHIAIVTSRNPKLQQPTEDWLQQHLAGYYDELILTGNHYDGVPYRSKVEVCLELGAVKLIDDQLYYARESAEKGLPFVLYGDYPWNQAPELPAGIVRVRDWSGVVDHLYT